MSNELDTYDDDAFLALAAGLSNLRKSAPASSGGASYLSFSDGVWAYGQDRIIPEAGAQLAVNVPAMKHGKILWANKPRRLIHEIMVPLNQPIPSEYDLPPAPEGVATDPWATVYSAPMTIINGTDAGTQVLFKMNSLGAAQAVTALVDEISARVARRRTDFYPIVELHGSSYENRNYGKTIHTPVFKIVGWFDHAERVHVLEGGGGIAVAAPAPAPARVAAAPSAPVSPAPRIRPAAAPAPAQDVPVDLAPPPEPAAAPAAAGRRRRVAG
jgi:hypothetical protein